MSLDDTCTKCGRHLYAFCEDAIDKKDEYIGWGYVGVDALCTACLLDREEAQGKEIERLLKLMTDARDVLVPEVGSASAIDVEHLAQSTAELLKAYRSKVQSLQARLDLISDEVKDERARHDAVGQGGQKAGDRSPRMNRSMLVELERLIGEEQGKYTYEYFLKMQEEINKLTSANKLSLAQAQIKHEENVKLKAENTELRFRIEKMREANWEEK